MSRKLIWVIFLFSVAMFISSVYYVNVSNRSKAGNHYTVQNQHPEVDLKIPGNPRIGGQLVVAVPSDPIILNPLLAKDANSLFVMTRLFNNLFANDGGFNIIPELAENWSSNNNRLWDIRLRKGVLWHDGKEFTADDVKFTYDLIILGTVKTDKATLFELKERKLEVEVVDRYTVRFRLPAPYPGFLSMLTVPIIPKHLYDGSDIYQNPHNYKPVGTGPFKMKEWKKNGYVLLEANKEYFFGRPFCDTLFLSIIKDYPKIIEGLGKGIIHAAEVPSFYYEKAHALPNVNTYVIDTCIQTFLGFNLRHPILGDKNVRKAIAHAINKEVLLARHTGGIGKPCVSHFPPAEFCKYTTDKVHHYDYAPEKALKILSGAGWKDNNGDGTLERNGRQLNFNILANIENQEQISVADEIRESLSQVGMEVIVRKLAKSELLKELANHEFDAVVLSFDLPPSPDMSGIWHSGQIDGGFNFFSYQNEIVDDLFERGRVTENPVKAEEIFREIQVILSEDLPTIPLYYSSIIFACNKRIVVPTPPSSGGPYLYVHKWYFNDITGNI